MSSSWARRERRTRALQKAALAVVMSVVVVAAIVLTALALARHFSFGQPPTAEPVWTPVPAPTPEPEPEPITVAVIGDSFVSGTEEQAASQQRWSDLLSSQLELPFLHIADPEAAYELTASVSYAELAANIPDGAGIVVLAGSQNDESGYDSILEGVLSALDIVSERVPGASIVVIGPQSAWDPPSVERNAARDAVRDGSAQAGALWIDPMFEGWLVGYPERLDADGLSFSPEGDRVVAERLLPDFERLLAALSE